MSPRLRVAGPRGALAIAMAVIAGVGLMSGCSTTSSAGVSAPSAPAGSTAPDLGNGTSQSGTPQSDTSKAVGAPAWLLTRSALSQLMADPAARADLGRSQVYEILQPGQRPLADVTAEPVITFASAAALTAAVTGGDIPIGTYAVLYDPEAWTFTPAAEQRNPVRAATQAAEVAHAHGLRLIVTPALNLASVLNHDSTQPRWQQFLSLNLVGRLAGVADIVELQAQSLERETATYSAFVRAAATQANAVNPKVTVLAGLSTNPPGAPVTVEHLTSAIRATRSVVAGYWMNIPGQGPRCPTCNAPRPDIAIATLQALR